MKQTGQPSSSHPPTTPTPPFKELTPWFPKYDIGRTTSPPAHDGDLLLHHPLRLRLQRLAKNHRTVTITVRYPSLRALDRRSNRLSPPANLRRGISPILRRRDRSASLQRRGRHAASHQQPAKHRRRLRPRKRRERVPRRRQPAPGESASRAESLLGRTGRRRARGFARAMDAGLQLPRYHQYHVPRHEIHGRPQRAFALGVHQGDWLYAYAGAGGCADVGSAGWVRGKVVQSEYET